MVIVVVVWLMMTEARTPMLAGARFGAYSTHAVYLQVHAYFCTLHALALVPWHFALCEQRRRMFARALRGSGLRVFVGVGGFLSSFSTPYADHGPAHAAPARRQRQDAPPTPARTTFTLVHGNPNAKEED